MNESTKKAIKDRISFLKDNMYRYEIDIKRRRQDAIVDFDNHENLIEEHKKEIVQLESDLRNI